MITIDKEQLIPLKDELLPLFEEHYKEVPAYAQLEVDPAWDLYEAYEADEDLVFFVARKEGEIIGYVCYLLGTYLHCQNETIADMNIIYVKPEYRGTNLGACLISEAEEHLFEVGVSIATINMKASASFETLAKSLDYDRMEIMYSKYLGE